MVPDYGHILFQPLYKGVEFSRTGGCTAFKNRFDPWWKEQLLFLITRSPQRHQQINYLHLELVCLDQQVAGYVRIILELESAFRDRDSAPRCQLFGKRGLVSSIEIEILRHQALKRIANTVSIEYFIRLFHLIRARKSAPIPTRDNHDAQGEN